MNEKLADPTVKHGIARLFAGLGFFFGGIKTIFKRPDLLGISLITILINLAVYVGLATIFFVFLKDLIDVTGIEMAWLRWVVGVLITIVWLILCIFLSLVIGSLLASPFLDMLSERTEKHLTGSVSPVPFAIGTTLRELAVQLALMARSLVIGLIATICFGWIPVVGWVVPFAVTAVFAGSNFLQPTLGRHRVPTKERVGVIRNNRILLLGFGAPFGIPFMFFLAPFFTPALIVGGTRLYLSLAAHDKVPSQLTASQRAHLLGAV